MLRTSSPQSSGCAAAPALLPEAARSAPRQALAGAEPELPQQGTDVSHFSYLGRLSEEESASQSAQPPTAPAGAAGAQTELQNVKVVMEE